MRYCNSVGVQSKPKEAEKPVSGVKMLMNKLKNVENQENLSKIESMQKLSVAEYFLLDIKKSKSDFLYV